MANLKRKMLYQQLTDFILGKLPKRYQANFESWIENGKLINQGKKITDDGIELAHIGYDAVLFFNEFPFNEVRPDYLMAWVQIWLNENDPVRDVLDQYEVDFDIEIVSDDIADLTFTIAFQEPLTAVKDSAGRLEIEGESYRLDEIEILTAQEVEIDADVIHDDSIKAEI
ncbi:phage tail protein [Aggregatibacter actinomycetemcomitans]|uniref:phage tail protein n=1 Tax=Aggregatibacter actinomycetemcomitans TaxID=714 RepID=UPI00197B55F7|nr:phage tail protein [Aggregatibacter actinomycetemcomitans]MBN6067870.1 phage tail protein [Aggregatibacter actinomycetemcomitans]MBN6085807.1 phage tail protein [Aggregatibacter actinomycetemcomitans]